MNWRGAHGIRDVHATRPEGVEGTVGGKARWVGKARRAGRGGGQIVCVKISALVHFQREGASEGGARWSMGGRVVGTFVAFTSGTPVDRSTDEYGAGCCAPLSVALVAKTCGVSTNSTQRSEEPWWGHDARLRCALIYPPALVVCSSRTGYALLAIEETDHRRQAVSAHCC